MHPVAFTLVSGLALGSAVLMVTRRNPVYSAVWLLVTFMSVAVLFLGLSGPFIAAVHVLVYAGAILVLFVFVIMLLNLKEEEFGEEYPASVRLGGAGLAAGLFTLLAVAILRDPSLAVPVAAPSPEYGSVEQVGMLLFSTYGLQFELVSVVIIVAMFGSLVLAKKRLWA